ncbi:hypothetical protein HDU67_006962 [Dinochytrium kinnereticum]|nr:hypothetical protein HDU67_006962 [Dinochytrium kinnereticum]
MGLSKSAVLVLKGFPRLPNANSLAVYILLFSTLQLGLIFLYSVKGIKHCQTIVLRKGSLERHRPAVRFALVVPFSGTQTDLVIRNVEKLWPRKVPCDPDRGYGNLIDLVFYSNRLGAVTPPVMKKLREEIIGTPSLSKCFRNVRFISARLSKEEDKYPYGPSHMFFKLFSESGARPLLKSPGGHGMDDLPYQAMYYMEPDNIPCRAHWLDRLYEEASIPGDFWMRGSIIRDRNPAVGGWSFANHMNGNALYRLDDQKFVDFISEVREHFWENPDQFVGGYDVALYLLRENRSFVPWVEYTSTAHLFQYTATVQNWYRKPVNSTELCSKAANRQTYLVHGRDVVW